MTSKILPGAVRDAIFECFGNSKETKTTKEIRAFVAEKLGPDVGPTSVRSYLNLNTPDRFERVSRGSYKLARR